MKIKKPVILIIFASVLVIAAGSLYFSFVLPFLNFMYNALPESPGSDSPSVLIEGDNVIDMNQYPKMTNPPYVTPEPTPTPPPEESMGTFSEIIYRQTVDFRLPENATNLLILGVDETADLTDSIFIMSIDKSTRIIRIISIPRDAYVRYDEKVVNALKSHGWTGKGLYKLNAAAVIGRDLLRYKDGQFSHSGVNFLCAVIEGMFGETFHIDDYVYMNFDGFMDIVNVFGGIWITSEEEIYNQYGELLVPKGRNFLSPKEALFYVRTRHRYDSNGVDRGSDGDPYRKKLQINFIKEMIVQYAKPENIGRMSEILTSLRSSVYHSLNSVTKIADYTQVAMDFVNKKYYVEFMLITGIDIDPFNDGASYVDVLRG